VQYLHHNYTGRAGEYRPIVPHKIIFGQGKTTDLKAEVELLGGRRALVLSGRSVAEKSAAVQTIATQLGELCVGVYSGLTQRAPLASAVAATQLALECGADTLVGVGGSTISDAARMIAVMMVEGLTSEEAVRARTDAHWRLACPDLSARSLPLQVAVPTTLSAGEFNMGGGKVMDDRAGHMINIRDPRLFAHLLLLDPELTTGTPDWLWFSTGIKALDHSIERLYTRCHQPATDAPVLMGAELLFRYLPQSGEGNRDLNARLQCQIAAWLSMQGVPNYGLGLSHALGHILGTRYGVAHGYTSCVTQPAVMVFNRPASAHKQAMLARAAGLDTRGMSDEAAAIAAAQAVSDLIRQLGMPAKLRDLEVVPRADFPVIAELTLQDGGCGANAVLVEHPEQVISVLEHAW